MTQLHDKRLIATLTGIDFSHIEEIDWADNRKVAEFCAKAAYLDLCRTLTYSKPKGISENEQDAAKQKFKQTIIDAVVNGVLRKLLCCDPAEFDSRHEALLKEVAEKAREETIDGTSAHVLKKRSEGQKSSSFTVGQAQKWVNMTIKYMWLTEKWNEQFDRLKNIVHAPIDNFILKELFDYKEKNGLSGKIYKNGSLYSVAQERFDQDDYSAKAPWSRLESISAYAALQKAIRNTHALDSGTLEWESRTWLTNAKSVANETRPDKRKNHSWAYDKSQRTILTDYKKSIDLVRTDIANLYEFYVLHTPCSTCMCHQRRDFSYYGWIGNIAKSGARKVLNEVLALDSDNFFLPERDKRANAEDEFAKRNLLNIPVEDLITERAVICLTNESNYFLRLFKHIRNCLAHGRFMAIHNENSETVLMMEDVDGRNITACMILKLNTLLTWRDVIINGPS